MCGIAGIVSDNPAHISKQLLRSMTNAIAHRGPDGEAHWINTNNNVGFGHRRLAIIDLSDAAAQPMHYGDRYAIIHNGEIYNYLELRKQLEQNNYRFRTQSDTEIIMAAYDYWKEDCLQYFDGMFAFALWDMRNKSYSQREIDSVKNLFTMRKKMEVCTSPVK
jgi:asparagine synthase (glutamine-hydrolysing)